VDLEAWRRRGRYVAGLVLLGVLGFFPFVRGVRVPLLGWIDLAIHEAGHVFAMPFPDIVTAAMGSGFQILVPLLLAVAFWVKERDPLGTAVTLGWAGAAMQDASVYIADAPYQRLPLIGGHHDWAWVLGPRGIDRLDLADEVSRVVLIAGMITWAAGVVWCLAGPRLARALNAGLRDPRPWVLWRAAPAVDAPPPLPSRRAHPDLPPAPAARPAAHARPAADGPSRPDDPPDGDRGPAGGPHADGSGDAARARVVW
jgi:hypothetical protein